MRNIKLLFSKTPKSIMDYNASWWGRLTLWSCLLFLYIPIIVLVVFSFNDSKRNIVWRGFTTKYYEKLWRNDTLQEALLNSITIAFATTILSVILATLAAYALSSFKFKGKGLFESALTIPIVVPEICIAIATMMFFNRINFPTDWVWPFNLTALTLAHTAFCFPFATLIIRARLDTFDPALHEAGLDMGANQWQILRDIIIPYLKPAIISGALLSFTLSLDDFVVTFFVSSPTSNTFPVTIYSLVRMGVTPEVNAVSTLLILLTVVLVALLMWRQSKESTIQ